MGEVETALRVRILGAIFCANFSLPINNTIHYCRLGVDSNRTLTGNIKKRDRPLSASVCADKKRALKEKLNNSNYATEQGPGLPETGDLEW